MKASRTTMTAAVTVAAAATVFTFATPALASGTAPAPAFASTVVVDDEDDVNDLRVAIVQLMSLPQAGSEVKDKGRAALNGTVEDMRAFLESGYRLAQAQDDRVALVQLYSMPTTSPALKTAIRSVLSTSDPEEMRWFLEVGQYEVTG
ncbi:ALF repeat-containing protein [Streptomyces sp. NPDC018972]|uniref:ALF repeat-containing protein n=1 Tax=Streptomyces sp. NPDC018972 TaxID=3365060 RepID=UPI0037A76690